MQNPTITSWAAGWTPDFYAGMIRDGYPVTMVTKLWPFYPINDAQERNRRSCNDPKCLAQLACTPESAALIKRVCLRLDNMSLNFSAKAYRLPFTEENRLKSPLVWTLTGGVLGEAPDDSPAAGDDVSVDDQKVADTLGPTVNWYNDGRLCGGSLFVQTMLTKFPNLEEIEIDDNNEAANDGIQRYLLPKSTTIRSYDELTGLSLRFRDWITIKRATNPSVNANDIAAEWFALRRGLYLAWIQGFASALPERLRNVRLVQYGGIDSTAVGELKSGLDRNVGYASQSYGDAGSPAFYLDAKDPMNSLAGNDGIVKMLNLIPGYECLERRNPTAMRDASIYIGPSAIMAGPPKGYRVISPELYDGYCTLLLWMLKGVGTPVSLRWYSKGGQPNTPMFDAAAQAALDALPDGSAIRDKTLGDYYKAAAEAAKRINDNPVFSEFYRRGHMVVVGGKGHPYRDTSAAGYPDPAIIGDNRWVLLECSPNPPRESWTRPKFAGSGKVNLDPATPALDPTTGMPVDMSMWACAAKHPDREQWLVIAYSPKLLFEGVTVDIPGYGIAEVGVPQPWSYTLVGDPGVPPPRPVVETFDARITGPDSAGIYKVERLG